MLPILKGYKFLRIRNTLTFPLILLNTWSVLRKEREESANAIEVKELAELDWAIFFLQADLKPE